MNHFTANFSFSSFVNFIQTSSCSGFDNLLKGLLILTNWICSIGVPEASQGCTMTGCKVNPFPSDCSSNLGNSSA